MSLRNLEFLIALLAFSARATVVDFGLPPTPTSPPDDNASRTALPIQSRDLNPLQIIPVPVGVDRLTTIRFPSPVSDLVSARVSTEPHPDALFVLTFHPGEAFFSVRALRSDAITSLNVVWRSQTYVLELIASPHPVLSLILTNPPVHRIISKPPPSLPSTTPHQKTADTPWQRYQAVAEREPSLRRLFPRGMHAVRQYAVGDSAETPLYGMRLDEVLAFPEDAVAVARLTVSNRTPLAVDPDAWRLDFTDNGKEIRIHHLDRPRPIPPFGSQTWFATLALPPGVDPGRFATNLHVRVRPSGENAPSKADRRP